MGRKFSMMYAYFILLTIKVLMAAHTQHMDKVSHIIIQNSSNPGVLDRQKNGY